jgi:branched-chain amino acid transport system substrate-binding protein
MTGDRRLLVAAAGSALLAAVPAAAAGAPPLVIAVESPQSGEQASNGLDQLRGAQLAVREVNARGGVLGRRVRIHRADDRGSAARAIPVARAVIARRIPFVIGPYNSSVGVRTLPLYRTNRVLPLWNTSLDATRGAGATVQPMNSQIAPVESRYILGTGAVRVAMIVDTPDGAFPAGMADRLAVRLRAGGATVVRLSVVRTGDAPPGHYAERVQQALAAGPDLVYVSTYFPEGVQIARALAASPSTAPCLMGLANVDIGFTSATTLAEAQRCVFSGVPAAGQMPSARGYVRRYRRAFNRRPGVWGSFYYDSARILFAAIRRAGGTEYGAVHRELRATRRFPGATGPITIDPRTGYRTNVPVHILRVGAGGAFVIVR